MGLIDAEEEIKWANENLPDIHAGVITAFLRDCATIDAVPIVRCKECKKWEADGSYEYDTDGIKRMYGSCSHSLFHCKDNHFCSYGERKEIKYE